MDQPARQCAAATKSGVRCKNRSLPDSDYCRVHQAAAQPAAAPEVPVEVIAQEFNKIAEDVARQAPDYKPPPFSRSALLNVLKANAEQLAAYLPVELIRDIIRNLEGTKKEDLFDPETWKGLWYILTYSFSTQSKAALEEVAKRLSVIPGMDMMLQFTQSVFESPRDLLSVDTWKGAAIVLNAAVHANLSSLRRRMLGEEG